MWYGPNILVEREDAESFVVGTDVTFINWGNVTITNINLDGSKKVLVVIHYALSDHRSDKSKSGRLVNTEIYDAC